MTGHRQILRRGPKFHRDTNLVDQITGTGANDMSAQDAVSGFIRQDFYKPVGGKICLGAAIAHKRKLTNLIGATAVFQRILGHADIGHFGVGVNHARDHVIIHMSVFAGDHLGGCHAFIFGFMRQHRAVDCIADGIDAGDVGPPMAVGFDLATVAHLDAQFGQSKPVCKGFAPCSDQNDIGIQLVLAVVFAQFITDFGFGLQAFNTLHRRAHDKAHTLLFQNSLKGFLHLGVHPRGDRVEKFYYGDLGAETGIDTAQFQTDHTGPDHHHFARNFIECQRAG